MSSAFPRSTPVDFLHSNTLVKHDWGKKEENAKEKACQYDKAWTEKEEERQESEGVEVSQFVL